MRVERKAWFLRLARRYVRGRLSRQFDGLHAARLDEAREILARGPAIIAMNHVGWWDTFVAVAFDEALEAESYCLMDAANLRRLPFFGWIGAVGLDRENPRQGIRDLKESAKLADRAGRAVWIFPQGRHVPAHLRPMRLQRGVGILAKAAPGVPVIPLSLSYLFREAPEPSIVAVFGEAFSSEQARGKDFLSALEARWIDGLDVADRFAVDREGAEDFSLVIAPKRRGGDGVPRLGRLLSRKGRREHALPAAKASVGAEEKSHA
ncbi:MAG: lysophospholipid acyltransferase family protein [Myxococcota bacterium]